MKLQLELRNDNGEWYFHVQTTDTSQPHLDRCCTGGFWLDAEGLDPCVSDFFNSRPAATVIPVTLDIPALPQCGFAGKKWIS